MLKSRNFWKTKRNSQVSIDRNCLVKTRISVREKGGKCPKPSKDNKTYSTRLKNNVDKPFTDIIYWYYLLILLILFR